MVTLKDRIAKIFKDSGKLQPAFAESIGIAEKTFRNYRDGATMPSIEALTKLATFYNVNCNWLLLGEGPIYRDQTPASQTSSQVKDTNINVLGYLHKTKSDNASISEDLQRLLAQIDEMQKTITSLTATNRQLVEKLLKP